MRSQFALVICSVLAAGAAAGCGQSSPPSSNASFGAPHVTPSPAPTSSTTSPSASPAASSPAPASTPAPPQAGVYSQMTVQVAQVAPEGYQNVSGQRVVVYALSLSIHNPTSAMIPLYLDDLSVEPQGASYRYSYNDRATAGLTSANSLFPWPVDAQAPGSVTAYVQPGGTLAGTITVEVAPAANYQVVWGGQSTPAATFPA